MTRAIKARDLYPDDRIEYERCCHSPLHPVTTQRMVEYQLLSLPEECDCESPKRRRFLAAGL